MHRIHAAEDTLQKSLQEGLIAHVSYLSSQTQGGIVIVLDQIGLHELKAKSAQSRQEV